MTSSNQSIIAIKILSSYKLSINDNEWYLFEFEKCDMTNDIDLFIFIFLNI